VAQVFFAEARVPKHSHSLVSVLECRRGKLLGWGKKGRKAQTPAVKAIEAEGDERSRTKEASLHWPWQWQFVSSRAKQAQGPSPACDTPDADHLGVQRHPLGEATTLVTPARHCVAVPWHCGAVPLGQDEPETTIGPKNIIGMFRVL
jgi:hypothetical protein